MIAPLPPPSQVANPAAATINKFLEERKNVVMELGSIVEQSLQSANHPCAVMQAFIKTQQGRDAGEFNTPKHFSEALQGMLDLERAIQVSAHSGVCCCCLNCFGLHPVWHEP